MISTFAEVLSSTFLIFIFPFSLAFSMLSIRDPVVPSKGTSVITSVFLSAFTIFCSASNFTSSDPVVIILRQSSLQLGSRDTRHLSPSESRNERHQ